MWHSLCLLAIECLWEFLLDTLINTEKLFQFFRSPTRWKALLKSVKNFNFQCLFNLFFSSFLPQSWSARPASEQRHRWSGPGEMGYRTLPVLNLSHLVGIASDYSLLFIHFSELMKSSGWNSSRSNFSHWTLLLGVGALSEHQREKRLISSLFFNSYFSIWKGISTSSKAS